MTRLRPADGLAGAAGALALVSLFLPWYTLRPGPAHLTGWQAFSVLDLLVALVGALGVAVTVASATRRSPTLPVGLAVLGAPVGALATVLALVRVLDPPGRLDAAAGGWLGLAGAIGVAACSWWSLADERNRRVPPVPVEVRRAPPAA
jgi:hypothetical protein